jgi:hypothetical protein
VYRDERKCGMIIITNEKLIKRNRRIAQVCSLLGLLVLFAGMIVSFRIPERIYIAFGALIVGFLLSQIGMYYTNRWGRNPRPDQLLNQALKGLENKYHLYHYTTPTAHLLVGPAGLWVLAPRYQKGTISYENNRWRHRGGNFLLKLYGAEGLGRPDLELPHEIEKVNKYLTNKLPGESIPSIQAALVFVHDNVEIQINNTNPPPIPTIYINKLKELIRKSAKTKPTSSEKIEQIQNVLSNEDIDTLK